MLRRAVFVLTTAMGLFSIAPVTSSFAHNPDMGRPQLIKISRTVISSGMSVASAFQPATGFATTSPVSAPAIDLGVFGSVAISAARLPAAEKWRQVTQVDFRAMFGPDCASSGLAGCNTRFANTLRGVAGQADGLSDLAMLGLVNRSVNGAMKYREDTALWGVGDYWATPSEIARKGAGDCEDFAIAKFWLLRSLGVPAEQLQLVVLQDTRRQLFHAVLVAHIGAGSYVLDNVTSRLNLDTAYAQYQPIMSFSGSHNYIHGFSGTNTAMAAMPKDLSVVAPGMAL
ncbi:putative transglutaminase-like cysteine proteinase [Devosia sp. UYZn731]|uniref:transglutaminase-like cysteine peptidase n=1 Tax=Devosia sp. UYZn731 TaxID=3156345 RepID=UPI003393FD76